MFQIQFRENSASGNRGWHGVSTQHGLRQFESLDQARRNFQDGWPDYEENPRCNFRILDLETLQVHPVGEPKFRAIFRRSDGEFSSFPDADPLGREFTSYDACVVNLRMFAPALGKKWPDDYLIFEFSSGTRLPVVGKGGPFIMVHPVVEKPSWDKWPEPLEVLRDKAAKLAEEIDRYCS